MEHTVAIGRHVRRAELQREKECQIAFSYIVLMHAYMCIHEKRTPKECFPQLSNLKELFRCVFGVAPSGVAKRHGGRCAPRRKMNPTRGRPTRTPGGTGGRIKAREVGDLSKQTTPTSSFLRVKITRDSKPTTPESSFRTRPTRSPVSPSSALLSKGRTSLEPVSEEGNSASHEWSGLSGFSGSRSASPGSETHTNNGCYLSPASLRPLAVALEAALDAPDADRVMEMAHVQMEAALHREVDRAKRIELASLREFAQRKTFAAKEEATRHVEATYKRILTEQRAIREELEAELASVRAIAANVTEAQAAVEKARLEAQREARDLGHVLRL